MAQRTFRLSQETIFCSICEGLLKDPTMTPCGHNYCVTCITDRWDKEDERKIYSCPLCREMFTPRPVLVRNTVLAFLVEKLKKTGLQAAPADRSYAGPEDVACDFCTGRKLKATKSCLLCLVSYCEKHLQPHLDVVPLKKHTLIEPCKNLQENICSRHGEVMKMFCRTDQRSICYLCSVEEHKGHDTVSAAAERTERPRELEVSRPKIQRRIQGRQRDLKVLQQEEEVINGAADKAVEGSEEIFTELIRVMEKRRRDAKQQVRSQQETEVSRVRELQEKLEQEITELEQDHNHQFLHSYPSVSALGEPPPSPSISIPPRRYFEDVTAAVSQLRDQLQDVLRKRWRDISQTGTGDVSLPEPEPEPKTRAQFLRYSLEITLDSNTAHTALLLSDGNRKAKRSIGSQFYYSHPDRFTNNVQVLSRESLTGRCYWEVKWKGVGVGVAVSSQRISRGAAGECLFGQNDKSWMLHYHKNNYNFYHDSVMTPVSGPQSSVIGVYLDRGAGLLSFYRVSKTMTFLHRFQATFTEPLCAGLWFHDDKSTAEFSLPK